MKSFTSQPFSGQKKIKNEAQQTEECSATKGASFPGLFNNNERATMNTSAENILQTNNAVSLYPLSLYPSLNSKQMVTVTQVLYMVTLTC